MSFPSEMQYAKKEKWPLIIPVGTLEYHGPHCAFGCDTLIALGLLKKLEKKKDIVIFPPLWYGVGSYAVAGPEKNSVTVDADVFEANVYYILKSLIYGGWENIYLLIHHQYEQETLMPMTLSCMKAAKKLTMGYMEETKGHGWWGSNDYKEYYEQLNEQDNPFNWIKVLPVMSTDVQNKTGYDHAGEWECSLLSALYPEAVKIERLVESDEWFIQSAALPSLEKGKEMIRLCVEDLNKKIV